MAKNTTATGSMIDGVTVVHPDNMGKGIKWNDTTKKYEVNVKAGSGIVINDNGELEVSDLQNQINQIKNRLNETCKVPCKNINSNYTVLDSDNVIISTASNPITVTFPNNIPTGRMFTIIQAGAGEITLANAGNHSFIAPREGGFKLGGVNAVVTVLYELGSTVRVFGDTKA